MYRQNVRFVVLVFLGIAFSSPTFAQESVDVCDISFLWPVPSTAAAANSLIGLDETLTEDGKAICPAGLFDELMRQADAIVLHDPDGSGSTVKIIFLDSQVKNLSNWKIAGIRIDPSAPGCSDKIRTDPTLGTLGQIRLIAQPVTIDGGDALAHDFTMHLAFDFLAPSSDAPFQPDEARMKPIIDELLAIKKELKEKGIETTGAKLGVHPGFSATDFDLTARLKTFLKNHLNQARINVTAFMGLSRVEPWVFFAVQKDRQTGSLGLVKSSSLGGSPGQAFGFVSSAPVIPVPSNQQFKEQGQGVATAPLFIPQSIENKAFPQSSDATLTRIKLKHIPDIIANPELSHVRSTDCVSCHTESNLRQSKLGGAVSEFAFKLPEGISGVDPSVLPQNRWNVRNFGWGFDRFGGNMTPTVAMRTANEAAECADFINRTYLTSQEEPEAEMVSNALTLVMKCKDERNFAQLKAKVKALLASDDNPINKALNEIGNVHFARFVFLEDSQQVMVITTYDGDFDTYISLFAEKIGGVFNVILAHVEGTENLKDDAGNVNVQEKLSEFQEFIEKHDLKAEEPFYSAYPDLTVQNIKQLQKLANEPN